MLWCFRFDLASPRVGLFGHGVVVLDHCLPEARRNPEPVHACGVRECSGKVVVVPRGDVAMESAGTSVTGLIAGLRTSARMVPPSM